MSAFAFNRDYHDTEQVRPFMDAYHARRSALVGEGEYPYNDSLRGHLGAEFVSQKDEDSAIYLCQKLRDLDALNVRIAAALSDGYEPFEGRPERDTKFARIVEYGFYSGGSGWREWTDARLIAVGANSRGVLPKGKRTNGFILSGRVLVKAQS